MYGGQLQQSFPSDQRVVAAASNAFSATNFQLVGKSPTPIFRYSDIPAIVPRDIASRSALRSAGDEDRQEGSREAPLPEGGIRFAIHPVTGLLLTTQTQPSSRDSSGPASPGHKPQRVDKFIVKVTNPTIVCLTVCLIARRFQSCWCHEELSSL